MIHEMHIRLPCEVWYIAFPKQLWGIELACLSLRRRASRINRIDSTNDTTREPRAIDPRPYLTSRFIEEKTGRKGISGCIWEGKQYSLWETYINKDSKFYYWMTTPIYIGAYENDQICMNEKHEIVGLYFWLRPDELESSISKLIEQNYIF